MSIKVGEIGQLFTYATYFDLSANTELTITFTSPEGVETVIDDSRITAPAAPYDDPTLGMLAASTYMQFTTLSTDFTESGEWTVYGTYEDATPRLLYGDCAKFDVLPVNCYTAPTVEVTTSTCGCTARRVCESCC